MPFCHLSSDRQVAGGGSEARQRGPTKCCRQESMSGQGWRLCGLHTGSPSPPRQAAALWSCSKEPCASSAGSRPLCPHGSPTLVPHPQERFVCQEKVFNHHRSAALWGPRVARRPRASNLCCQGKMGWQLCAGSYEAKQPVWTQQGCFLRSAAARRVRRGFLTFF